MIELTILFGLYIFVSGVITYTLHRLARDERKDLEDRIMALSKPDALITHKALTDPEPANITYIDEAKEYELAHNGGIDLLGDN